MPYISQLAFYDTGLKKWSPDRDQETSQSSQRVLYEGHNPINYNSTDYKIPPIDPDAPVVVPWGYTENSFELSPYKSASTSQSSSFIQPDQIPTAMQDITKYSRQSGSVQVSFIREIRAVYNRMLRTPSEHTIDGFGEWEFINLIREFYWAKQKTYFPASWTDGIFKNLRIKIGKLPMRLNEDAEFGVSTGATVSPINHYGRCRDKTPNRCARTRTNHKIWKD